jgi:hypothetical protein
MQQFEHSYRGVSYGFNPGGQCVFESEPPGEARKWFHWLRFFTPDEAHNINRGAVKWQETQRLIHKGIDRAVNNEPLYTGKIEDIPRYKHE